jgi:hypothetical protein
MNNSFNVDRYRLELRIEMKIAHIILLPMSIILAKHSIAYCEIHCKSVWLSQLQTVLTTGVVARIVRTTNKHNGKVMRSNTTQIEIYCEQI